MAVGVAYAMYPAQLLIMDRQCRMLIFQHPINSSATMADLCAMRSLTATLATLLFAAFAYGQNPPMHMGPRIGLGLATQSVGGFFRNTNDLMPAPVLGWHFEFAFHPQLSIMPEVLWMSKGFSVRNPAETTRTRAAFRYLEMPVLFKIHMEKKKFDEGLYLLVGPSLGYFLNGRSRTWKERDLIFDDIYNEPRNGGRRLEFSGVIAMGKEWARTAFDIRAQSSIAPFEKLTNVRNVVYSATWAYRLTPGVSRQR